jgi:hypothetical protein
MVNDGCRVKVTPDRSSRNMPSIAKIIEDETGAKLLSNPTAGEPAIYSCENRRQLALVIGKAIYYLDKKPEITLNC